MPPSSTSAGTTPRQFSTSGTGTVELNHVFVYGGTGSVAFSGNPPIWTAPTEGPFDVLAYWSDMSATASNAQRSSFTITGGSGANLTGVFFTPEATPVQAGRRWQLGPAQRAVHLVSADGHRWRHPQREPHAGLDLPALGGRNAHPLSPAARGRSPHRPASAPVHEHAHAAS